MTSNESNAGSNNNNGLTGLAHFLYLGAGIGLISAIAMLFVIVFFYGQSMGLSAGDCTVLSCVMTILLSQPAGIAGILAGAAVGAICGYIGHRIHTS